MILAPLLACALLAACGGSSGVFDGVSESELAAAGIAIVDTSPQAAAAVARADAIDDAGASPGELIGAHLVAARFDVNNDRAQRLAWAVEMNPAHEFHCGGCTQASCTFDRNTDVAIIFIDANSGEFLNCYAKTLSAPADTFAATGVPNASPVAAVLHSVTKEQLREKGVQVFEPTDRRVVVSSARAAELATENAVMNGYQDADVQEVDLVRLVMRHAAPAVDTLAWAVVFDPDTMTPQVYGVGAVSQDFAQGNPDVNSGAPYTVFAVSLIDAQTGDEIYYASQAVIPFDTPERSSQ